MVHNFARSRGAQRSHQRELVNTAQTFVDLNGISSEARFRRLKRELHRSLSDNGLIETITFARRERGRNLAGMGKKELIETALHRIDHLYPGPRTLEAFRIEDPHLVKVLEQRELLETVVRIARKRKLMESE